MEVWVGKTGRSGGAPGRCSRELGFLTWGRSTLEVVAPPWFSRVIPNSRAVSLRILHYESPDQPLKKWSLTSRVPWSFGAVVGRPRKAIQLQQQRFPELRWVRADARRMPAFADGSFDVVIEKALSLGRWLGQGRSEAWTHSA